MLLPAQPQKLTYLSHRQSLARHLDPLLLGKRSTLPSVEDCQRQPSGAVITGMIKITGIDDHDRPEFASSSCRVHRLRPLGGLEQARAINLASAAPSKMRGLAEAGECLRV